MFNRIIDWAVINRLLVVIALITLTVSAVFIIPKLNLDAFPDVTNVQVSVNTEAPGLAAEEVEQLITYPIEAVMYALPDVEEVRSISKTGLSGVTVVFKEGTDIYFARQLVFFAASGCQGADPRWRRHAGNGPEYFRSGSGLSVSSRGRTRCRFRCHGIAQFERLGGEAAIDSGRGCDRCAIVRR